MTRLTPLWFALAAVAITALLALAAGWLATSGLHQFLAERSKWWWPLVSNGVLLIALMAALLPVGIAVHRRVRRGRLDAFGGLRGR